MCMSEPEHIVSLYNSSVEAVFTNPGADKPHTESEPGWPDRHGVTDQVFADRTNDECYLGVPNMLTDFGAV